MKRIPYGETDFMTIRRENSYYVDKTAFSSYFKNAAKYLIMSCFTIPNNDTIRLQYGAS
jgi:hypothetical protein